MKRIVFYSAGLVVLTFFLGPCLFAQEPVKDIQDLVGAKGGQAEMVLENRGYTFVGLGAGSRSDHMYWRQPKTSRCVAIRTSDGRYRAIFYATSADCDKAAANKPTAPAPSKTGFATVCGVTQDAKKYRFRCTVEGVTTGAPGETVLHFPDNTVKLKWLGADKASATFEGMYPQDVSYTTTEGITRFTFEDRPYFYVSDRNLATQEIKKLN